MRHGIFAAALMALIAATNDGTAQPPAKDKATQLIELRAQEKFLQDQLKVVQDKIKVLEPEPKRGPVGPKIDPKKDNGSVAGLPDDPFGGKTVYEKKDGKWTARPVKGNLTVANHWNGNPEFKDSPGTRYAKESESDTQYVWVSTWKDGVSVFGPGWVPMKSDGAAVPITQFDPRDAGGTKTLYVKVVADAPEGRGWVRVIVPAGGFKEVDKKAKWNDGKFEQGPGKYFSVPALLGDPEKEKGKLAMWAPAGVKEGSFVLPSGFYETSAPGELLTWKTPNDKKGGNLPPLPGVRPTPFDPDGSSQKLPDGKLPPGVIPGSIPAPPRKN